MPNTTKERGRTVRRHGRAPAHRTIPVPEHLRDTHYKGAERLGHGKGYEYAHDHPGHFVAQDYLGVDKTFYEPTDQGVEKKIKDRLENWRRQFSEKKRTADEH